MNEGNLADIYSHFSERMDIKQIPVLDLPVIKTTEFDKGDGARVFNCLAEYYIKKDISPLPVQEIKRGSESILAIPSPRAERYNEMFCHLSDASIQPIPPKDLSMLEFEKEEYLMRINYQKDENNYGKKVDDASLILAVNSSPLTNTNGMFIPVQQTTSSEVPEERYYEMRQEPLSLLPEHISFLQNFSKNADAFVYWINAHPTIGRQHYQFMSNTIDGFQLPGVKAIKEGKFGDDYISIFGDLKMPCIHIKDISELNTTLQLLSKIGNLRTNLFIVDGEPFITLQNDDNGIINFGNSKYGMQYVRPTSEFMGYAVVNDVNDVASLSEKDILEYYSKIYSKLLNPEEISSIRNELNKM